MTEILENYNKDAQSFCTKQVTTEWEFQTDVMDEEKQKAAVRFCCFLKKNVCF